MEKLVGKDGQTKAVVITAEEISQWERESLEISMKAVESKPLMYRGLKGLLDIARQQVEVDEYTVLAERIAEKCKELVKIGAGTIFYHSMKDIDPQQYGRARTFKTECRRLDGRIEKLEKFMEKGE